MFLRGMVQKFLPFHGVATFTYVTEYALNRRIYFKSKDIHDHVTIPQSCTVIGDLYVLQKL